MEFTLLLEPLDFLGQRQASTATTSLAIGRPTPRAIAKGVLYPELELPVGLEELVVGVALGALEEGNVEAALSTLMVGLALAKTGDVVDEGELVGVPAESPVAKGIVFFPAEAVDVAVAARPFAAPPQTKATALAP